MTMCLTDPTASVYLVYTRTNGIEYQDAVHLTTTDLSVARETAQNLAKETPGMEVWIVSRLSVFVAEITVIER